MLSKLGYSIAFFFILLLVFRKIMDPKKLRLSPDDPSSFSRPDLCIVREIHLKLDVNFDKKVLSGKVDLKIEKINLETNEVILDVKDLNIHSIINSDTKENLKYTVTDNVPIFGSKLTIFLPEGNEKKFNICVTYETSPNASGLQWLDPNLTLDKEEPFLFSQCQAVHARSVLPCQDTPAVKVPYTATITAPEQITVLMSAVKTETLPDADSKKKVFKFEQNVPIPAYLIAIAAGKLESRRLGPRSHVWAEPGLIEKAAYEFTETETMLQTAEEVCGPYVWGTYDLLVLPPSFPFGGMENPCLTFVTPTIIAGDRSLALVVAHEIAHSWTGNLITNRNFEHFWLNEGFTVFVERKIAGRMKGSAVQDFEAITGINTLTETVKKLGETSPLTQLVLNLDGIHPDDSFSSVPYEKGHIFLRYLENVVGGPAQFEPFLKMYLNKFKNRSIDSNDFKTEFVNNFKACETIANIDWDSWFNKPGMPPVIPKYDTTLANICAELKDKWLAWDESKDGVFTPKDIADMNANQVDYFLQLLLESDPIPVSKLKIMEKIYNLDKIMNAEIRFRWIRIGLKARWMDKVDDALKMVSEVGRMKFVRPLYQDLHNWEEVRPRAVEIFRKNQKYMMHVSAYTVSKDLHVDL